MANLTIMALNVCYSICIFLTKYPKVLPLFLNFKFFTAKFSRVRKFRNFTVMIYAKTKTRSFLITRLISRAISNSLYPRHLCRRVYSFRLSVRPFVCSFVRNSVTFVEFASKFCVKVSQVVYISATTYQKAFIFGP